MKGGKQGRPRKAGAAARKPDARGPAKKKGGAAKRAWSDAPKKGNRGKTFGGRSSTDVE